MKIKVPTAILAIAISFSLASSQFPNYLEKFRNDNNGINLKNTNLSLKDLSNIKINNSNLINVLLEESNLENTVLSNSLIEMASLYRSNLNNASFFKSQLEDINIRNAKLSNTNFIETNFYLIDFSTDLTKWSSITKRVIDAILKKIKSINPFSKLEKKIYREYEINKKTNFSKSIFRTVDFRNSVFIKANFNNSEISDAFFDKAHIIESSFNNSTLKDVSFLGTNLSQTSFKNARFINNVDFTNADVKDADFANTKGLTPEQKKYLHNNGALNVYSKVTQPTLRNFLKIKKQSESKNKSTVITENTSLAFA